MKNTDRLADLLRQEIAAYSRLLQIEREKEEAITANDSERLLEVLAKEEPAVDEANALERGILACRDEIAAEVLGEASDATLREIIAQLQPQEPGELEQLRVKLFGFAEEIRRINQTNYLLLKQSVELLDEVVSAILGEAPCNTYEQSGRMQTNNISRPSVLSVEA
jgi:flagellar biosynthesis/type III secretory pathway chaperone